MKIGAYQFGVSGNMDANLSAIKHAVESAAESGVRLLVFPECGITGYPPRDIRRAADVDFEKLEQVFDRLNMLSEKHEMCIIAGSVTKDGDQIYNSAAVFMPGSGHISYHKRALWGWDQENFTPGSKTCIIDLDGLRIGICICYEVRFPEYFRELYRLQTDLNIVLFYDVSDSEDSERYDLIRAHLRTRASENVCAVLSVNAAGPFQTAPTALFSSSGHPLAELAPGCSGLLAYDFLPVPPDFSGRGRKYISDTLAKPT